MAQVLGSTSDNRCVYKKRSQVADSSTVLRLPLQHLQDHKVNSVAGIGSARTRTPWEMSRSKSLSRLKAKVYSTEDLMDFSDVFHSPLQSPTTLEHEMHVPESPSPWSTTSHGSRRSSRKIILRPAKSSHALVSRSSSISDHHATNIGGPVLLLDPRFPPRTSSFQSPDATSNDSRTGSRSRSQTVPQRRLRRPTAAPIQARCSTIDSTVPTISAMPSLSFSSDVTASNISSVQPSPMETGTLNIWPTPTRDRSQIPRSSDPEMLVLANSRYMQEVTSPLAIIPIMLDESSRPAEAIPSSEGFSRDRTYWSDEMDWTSPLKDSMTHEQTIFDERTSRRRINSKARSPAMYIDKPLPSLPNQPSCNHVQHPASPTSSAPILSHPLPPRTTLETSSDPVRSSVEKEMSNALQAAHEHSASASSLFGSHFEWEDRNRASARKPAERKAKFSRSCKQFLHKLSSTGITKDEA